MPDKTLEVLLKFGLDKTNADRAADSLKKIERGAESAERRLNRLRESAEKMNMVGMTIAGVGAAIGAPLMMAVNTYVSKIGEAGTVSREWLETQKSLEETQMRIGRVAAQTLLPYLKDAARLAGQVADFVEQNPDAVKLALGTAAAAVGIGGTVSAISTAVTTGAALVGVLTQAGIIGAGAMATGGAATGLTAVGTAAAGIVAPLAAAAAALVALGVSTFNIAQGITKDVGWMSDTLIASSKDFADYQSKVAALKKRPEWALIQFGFYEAPDAGTWQALNSEYAKNPSLMQDLVTPSIFNGNGNAPPNSGVPLADAGLSRRGASGASSTSAGSDWRVNYLSAQAKAKKEVEVETADYNALVQRRLQDLEADLSQMQTDYDDERLKRIRDFQLNEARLEEDYYAARAETARQYDTETQQREAEHQKEIRRMAEDNAAENDDLIRSRDALGLVKALRKQETERQRKEEDYQDETSQRNAAYAEALRSAETQYILQKERRQQDYQTQLSDAAQAFEQQREQRRKQTEQQLTDDGEAFRKRKKQIDDQLAEIFAAISAGLTGLKGKGRSTPQMATGGYAGLGQYLLGERGPEYVLNASTTRAAERVLGGGLSQERVLRGLSGGASVDVGGITVHGADVETAARLAGEIVTQRVREAFQKARGR